MTARGEKLYTLRSPLLWTTLSAFAVLVPLTGPFHAVPQMRYPDEIQPRVDLFHDAKSFGLIAAAWFIAFTVFTAVPILVRWRSEETMRIKKALVGVGLSLMPPALAMVVMLRTWPPY